jgi:aminopeptidase N
MAKYGDFACSVGEVTDKAPGGTTFMRIGRRVAMIVLLSLAGCSPAPTGSPPPASPSPAPTASPSSSFAVDLGLGEPLDPTLGNPGYDVGHYDIDLTFDPDSSWLEATVTLSATATERLASVNVDFIGFDVEQATVDGRASAFARTERDMTIQPATPIASGEQFELAVRYHGTPHPFTSTSGAPRGRLGWNTGSGTSYVVSEPDGARSWFPCNDVPSDKARYTFRLTVPDSVTAAANGVLEDKVANRGRTTWVWQMDQPMATYLATVVIGDYEIVEDSASSKAAGVPIRNLLPAGVSHIPAMPDGLEGQMVAFMAKYLGPFPFDAYGIAYVPQLKMGGGLECQTLSVLDTTLERYLAHELAHQWLGDYVTPAHWRDIWLNEGFATYLEWLWMDHRGLTTLDEYVATAYEDPYLLPPGDPSAHDMFNYSVYRRGALTLHALRARVGDATFFTILRTWVERYGGRSATTSDFIALAEEKSGADLTQFFQDWLYAQFMPEQNSGGLERETGLEPATFSLEG